jgi:cobalt-zinc-cadmium efflux system membrane fusion protein
MKIIVVASPPTSGTTTIIWNPNKIRIPVLSFQIPQSFKVPVKKLCAWSGAPISDPALWWRCFGNAPGRRSTLLPGLAALAIAAAGCHKSPPATESPDIRVEGDRVIVTPGSPPASSITVATSALPTATVLSFNGRLVWDDNVTTRLFTPFGGRVTKIPVEVGERVEVGAPLAVIASPDFGQVQADARRAATDFVLAERTLTRVNDLFAHGAAAQKDLQSAEADLERTRLEKQRATERLALYGADTNGVDQAYVFRSPIMGVLVEKNISSGAELRADLMLANTPQLASPQFVVTDPERLWVLIDVPERDEARVRVGQRFTVKSASLPGKPFSGRVVVVGDGLDPNTRTIKVRGSLANPGRWLKAEMFVQAEVPLVPEAGVVVPARAVFLRGEQHCVIVEDAPGRYGRRVVTLGAERSGQVLVTAGLVVGQRVVTDGAMLLEQLFSTGP